MINKKLVIIAHLPHNKEKGLYYSYEPYVRELELWAKLFKNVEIYTDVVKTRPLWSVKQIPENCFVKNVYLTSGSGGWKNFVRVIELPVATIQIFFALVRSDILHFRSPGATTIIANFLNKFLNKRVIVKWATFFGEMPIDSFTIKWERKFLLSPPSNTRVLIYGEGIDKNHISFFPAMFSEGELKKIMDSNTKKEWEMPYQFLCVGRLFIYKSFDLVLNGLIVFKEKYPKVKWHLTIIGDGEERKRLESIATNGNIMDSVHFIGSKVFRETIKYYQKSHIVIMPGMYEGWPKVINEAWATGCLPFVVNFGNATYPFKLSGGGGACFDPDPNSFADSLAELLDRPVDELEQTIKIGQQANFKMTLEKYFEGIEKEIKNLLI